MTKLVSQGLDFHLVAQLLGFIIKDGYKIKYLRVTFSEREYWIKLPKELRQNFDTAITPGCWLEIRGSQQLDEKKGVLNLKAEDIKLTSAPNKSDTQLLVPQPEIVEKKTAKGTILICQKSDCWKRGGKAVCQMLEDKLSDRGLSDRVQVKTTGCLKQCKQGPNVVIMPDKARYSQVKPHQVETLLDRHFNFYQQ